MRSTAPLGRCCPRNYFYAGLAAHVIAFVLTRGMPSNAVHGAARISGVMLGGVMVAAIGLYAALHVPGGKIGIAPRRHASTRIADTVKMIWKEDFVPLNADRLLHCARRRSSRSSLLSWCSPSCPSATASASPTRASAGSWSSAISPTSFRPWRATASVCAGHFVPLQIADLNVGILYLFAISSTGVIGAAIAGWASDNKFSLLGGLRAASQMVSYEVAMGLSLMGLLLIYSTVRMNPMVEWQNNHAWGFFVQPLGFFMFLAAALAETKRVPFDQPEGESEIVAGYFVEYSGFKWGMFMAGEYVEVITSSALLITLFFGGYSLPFLFADGLNVHLGDTVLFTYMMNHLAVSLLQVVAFFGKTTVMAFVQIFFRWTLPRFRYDQLMRFGWTKLLPFAIANLVVTAIVVVAIDQSNPAVASALSMVGDATQLLVALLMLAVPVGIIALMLRPTHRVRFLQSTTARFAAAAGGTRTTAMQA